MREFLEDVLTMPHYENYAAESGKVHNTAKHEEAVEDKLVKHQLREISKEAYTSGEVGFVSQPNGKQNNPDFWVRTPEGKSYHLECKSVKGNTTAPMYNSAIPKPDMIYIFCCE